MKPENRLIARIHSKLHPDIYREKMFNPMRGGTPDAYYMGFLDDLWVEWKWVPKFSTVVRPALTPLQLAWLMRAHDRGQKAAAIVGSPDGCVVLTSPVHWSKGVRLSEALVRSDQEVRDWIIAQCGLDSLGRQHSGLSKSTP